MDRSEPVTRTRRSGPVRPVAVALFTLLLVSGPALAACSSGHSAEADAGWTAPMPTMEPQAPPSAPAAADTPIAAEAVWAARPDYVRTKAATEEAYHYALQHPEIVQWMPCYCGCAAMGHGSNLDCYYKHGQPGDRAVFEEHASYCDICVQITLKAKHLIEQGVSLREVRQVIDQTFGGTAPGTHTDLPPA